MTPEEQKLVIWCKGNLVAAKFLSDVFAMSQLADDIADKDVRPDRVGDLLMLIFGTLVPNDFWRQWQHILGPQIFQAVMAWDLSNAISSGGIDSRMMAWAWRELGETLVGSVANIIAGPQWAREVMLEVHGYYHVEDPESFEDWDKEQHHG